MPKINQEEYEVLKGLDNYWKWKWIARDSAGLDSYNLHSYSEKPHKDYGTKAWSTDNNRSILIYEQPFQFIQWEDEEPHNIAELIEEYESEETEVKDIEQAIKEIEGLETETSQNFPHVEMIEKEIVLSILNLFVPKQEVPVVPTWFDEWWKNATKGEGNLFNNIEQFYDELFNSGTSEIYSCISSPDKKKKLLNIIINELDYVVEEEQKYVVEMGKSIYNTTTYGQIGEVSGQKIMLSVYASEEGMMIPSKYTKQEILKVENGMDIFKDYAVKVEELEE